MRVLAYSDSRLFSGAEAVFAAVCTGLADAGVDLTLAFPRANSGLSRALDGSSTSGSAALDVPAQGLRVAAAQLWNPVRLWRLRRVLCSGGWDATLVNLPSVEYGSAPMLSMGAEAGASVGLVHIHHRPADLGFRLGALRTRLARPLLRRFDHLLVAAPCGLDAVQRDWGVARERISHLPYPYPAPVLEDRQAARRSLGLPADRTVVALLGRLSLRQKGHDVLLASAARALDQRPDLLFAFFGEGPDRARIEAEVEKLDLSSNVRLLGEVKPGARALSAADLVVIPSRFEGLPLVALEALAAGRAGVASNVDGLGAVWPADWSVPPDRPDELADAIVRLAGTPACALQAGLEQGRAAARRLTAEHPAEAVLSALERVTEPAAR